MNKILITTCVIIFLGISIVGMVILDNFNKVEHVDIIYENPTITIEAANIIGPFLDINVSEDNQVTGYLFLFNENISIESKKFYTYAYLLGRWELQREFGYHNLRLSEEYPLLTTILKDSMTNKTYTKKYWKLEHFTGEDDCVLERPGFCFIRYTYNAEQGESKQ